MAAPPSQVPAFELPEILAGANPEFTDAVSFAEWLRTVPLINVAPSHNRILGQVEELNCFDVEPIERLRIMELLLEPAMFVQSEHAKKFSGRPVPLAKQEHDIFYDVVALWEGLWHGYGHCLKSITARNPALSGEAALVCQRALWCAGRRLTEFHKAFQEIAAEDWLLVHRIFTLAEELGLLDKEVPDPAQKTRNTSCLQTYVQSLLLHMANDPAERSPKQMAILMRWLEALAPKVSISRNPASGAQDLAPLSVDLASGRGGVHEVLQGESVRHLAMEGVAASIRSNVARLRRGEAPAALGLGEDISAGAAEQLLLVVFRQWCDKPKPRGAARRSVSTPAQMCLGVSATHFYASGKPFRQPLAPRELTKAQREEIATFGRIATRQEDEYDALHGFVLENWTIREESLGGLRIERAEGGGKSRLVQQQLIAVRPADAKGFMLGIVCWLSVAENADLRAGVRILPGPPQCVAVRATGLNASSEKFVPALLLPAVPALQSAPTLVLPTGWYRAKRVVEVYSDKLEQILLTGIVDRGIDFERVSLAAP